MRHDLGKLAQARISDIASLRQRLLTSGSAFAADARTPLRGFRVKRLSWLRLRALARRLGRVVGHGARRLVYKSKRRVRRVTWK